MRLGIQLGFIFILVFSSGCSFGLQEELRNAESSLSDDVTDRENASGSTDPGPLNLVFSGSKFLRYDQNEDSIAESELIEIEFTSDDPITVSISISKDSESDPDILSEDDFQVDLDTNPGKILLSFTSLANQIGASTVVVSVSNSEYSEDLELGVLIGSYCNSERRGWTNFNDSGATGTLEDPHLICSSDQLFDLAGYDNSSDETRRAYATKMGHSYRLMKDINLESTNPANQGLTWTPIGVEWKVTDPFNPPFLLTNEKTFHGNFDGNGYQIEGLYQSTSDFELAGFFGQIKAVDKNQNGSIEQNERPIIENLILNNFEIENSNIGAGAIASKVESADIRNITVGFVTTRGQSYVGGLIGDATDLNIEMVEILGQMVVGTDTAYTVGGVVGSISDSGSISEVWKATDSEDLVVYAASEGGLIAGKASGSIMFSDIALLSIDSDPVKLIAQGSGGDYGGIVGFAKGPVSINRAGVAGELHLLPTGNPANSSTMGGLIGRLDDSAQGYPTINQSYFKGSIELHVDQVYGIGGLVGSAGNGTLGGYSVTIVDSHVDLSFGLTSIGGVLQSQGIGGLIGISDSAYIQSSFVTGELTPVASYATEVGGLVGTITAAEEITCRHVLSAVTVSGDTVGALGGNTVPGVCASSSSNDVYRVPGAVSGTTVVEVEPVSNWSGVVEFTAAPFTGFADGVWTPYDENLDSLPDTFRLRKVPYPED